MIDGVGVEIAARAFHRDRAQQSGRRELMQCVVDGRERHMHTRSQCLVVQFFGGHVPMPAPEQQFRQRQTLPRWPQPGMTQPIGQLLNGRICCLRH